MLVLQSDRPRGRDAREWCIVDDKLVIQNDCEPVILHRDMKAIPLSDWFVRAEARRAGRADLGEVAALRRVGS